LQTRFDLLQCRTHTLRYAVTMDGKPTMLSHFATLVGKTKKVKRLRRAYTRFCSAFDRIATKFDQTGLFFVEIQAKLGKACMEFLQAGRCFRMALKTNHG